MNAAVLNINEVLLRLSNIQNCNELHNVANLYSYVQTYSLSNSLAVNSDEN